MIISFRRNAAVDRVVKRIKRKVAKSIADNGVVVPQMVCCHADVRIIDRMEANI
jgi:hypothetical protein